MNLKIYLKLFVTNIKVTIEFSLKTKMSFFLFKVRRYATLLVIRIVCAQIFSRIMSAVASWGVLVGMCPQFELFGYLLTFFVTFYASNINRECPQSEVLNIVHHQ